MKKNFEKPSIEKCEFMVAARLDVSGGGTAHSAGQGSACTKTASNGSKSCALPAVKNSGSQNSAC